MVPAQPPLPTPANFPFQLPSGSQTSKTICDSAVGAMTPATRQKGGRLPITFVDPAGVNDPVLIASALVIFVAGSCCRARLAHDSADGVCANAAVWTIIRNTLADPTIPDRDLITVPPAWATVHRFPGP
jgi:hypothetical protein